MIRPVGTFLFLSLFLAFSNASSAEVSTNQILIHGTVTFESGESHTGYIRWENEEATWDDLFHCGYRESPWADHIDTDAFQKEKRDHFYQTHGLLKRLAYALNEEDVDVPGWRMFLSSFGDIQSFEIHSGEDDYVVTADGARHRIGGYANDNGSDLWLYEKGQEPLEIEWNDLVSIEFSQAPADHIPFATRLFGTVETTEGDFTGPIMWDKSECLSIDLLDGENESGDLSLAMGNLRSIKKVDNKSVVIEQKDGQVFNMWGSNDVDSGNRGIWILTPEYGWVDIPWKRFIKATFRDGPGGGTPRTAFHNSLPLKGTVRLTDQTTRQGRLVYDLDEGYAWDYFNGNHRLVGYDIPFTLITKVQRLNEEKCRVHLQSGQILELSENQDTGSENGGLLVFSPDETSTEYIPWRLVEAVEFSREP
jgi:hypothetical protein